MSAFVSQRNYDPVCHESGASVGRPGSIGRADLNTLPIAFLSFAFGRQIEICGLGPFRGNVKRQLGIKPTIARWHFVCG